MMKARWLLVGAVALVGLALVAPGCGKKEEDKAKPAKEAAKIKLPDAVAKALKAEFPKAEITKVAKEKEGGVPFYDIDFKDGDEERAIDIATDGAVLSISLVIEDKEVPEAVMKALQGALDGGKIEQIEKREVRREAKDLIVTALDKPKIEYEAELKKGDLEATVLVDDKGTVLEAPKWEKPEKE
jgi:uncharacterized membrane protein YkoI